MDVKKANTLGWWKEEHFEKWCHLNMRVIRSLLCLKLTVSLILVYALASTRSLMMSGRPLMKEMVSAVFPS
jgi:hypothetical protein